MCFPGNCLNSPGGAQECCDFLGSRNRCTHSCLCHSGGHGSVPACWRGRLSPCTLVCSAVGGHGAGSGPYRIGSGEDSKMVLAESHVIAIGSPKWLLPSISIMALFTIA